MGESQIIRKLLLVCTDQQKLLSDSNLYILMAIYKICTLFFRIKFANHSIIMIKERSKKQKEKKQDNKQCEVCRWKTYEAGTLEQLVCTDCKRCVHRNCYQPSLKDKKNFKCDECRRNVEKKKIKCEICLNTNGILKQAGQKLWVHVLCGLSSSKIKISQYKNLEFRPLNHGNSNPKKLNESKICLLCNNPKTEGVQCYDNQCHSHAHIGCIISYPVLDGEEENYLTYGILDRNENCLMNRLIDYRNIFNYFPIFKQPKQKIKYFVCKLHNQQQSPAFIWCICNQNKNETQICCDQCSRWFHNSCVNVEGNMEYWKCNGCKNNNLFQKYVRFPYLIQKIVEIQANPKLDQNAIKFLNCFQFTLSEHLQKNIRDKKNIYEIQAYMLMKSLEQNCDFQDEGREKKLLNNINIIQVLYFLIKKIKKQITDITKEELKEINEVLKSNYGLNWSNTEARKIYQKYFENKIKQLMPQSQSRQIIIKLQNFIRKYSTSRNIQIDTLSKEVKHLVQFMQKNNSLTKDLGKLIQNNQEKRLFGLFYQSNMDEQTICSIINNIKLLYQAKRQQCLLESHFIQIAYKKHTNLAKNKQKILSNIYKGLMKGLKIKRQYQQKLELIQQAENISMNQPLNFKKIEKLKQICINKGAFLDITSTFKNLQSREIQYLIQKRKLMRLMKSCENSRVDSLINEIQLFLKEDQQLQILNSQEKHLFQKYVVSYNFFVNIIRYHNDTHRLNHHWSQTISSAASEMVNEPIQNENESEQEGAYISYKASTAMRLISLNNPLHQIAANAILNWEKTEHAINFAFQKLYQLAKSNINLSVAEAQIVNNFAEDIIEKLRLRSQNYCKHYKPYFLQKIWQVIKFNKLQQSFEDYQQILDAYKDWKRDLEINFSNFQQTLQSVQAAEALMKMIESMLSQVQHLQVNIEQELRKLKIVRMWCQVSIKYLNESRPTINDIQMLKNLMDRINYPKNKIRQKVDQLDIYSTTLNKKVAKFLQKPKICDMEIYEELKFLSNKMAISQAEELKNELTESGLDVSVELQQLEEQIKQFSKIPKSLTSFIDSQNCSDSLNLMRRRILQNAFRYQNYDHYVYLVNKIYEYKCREHTGFTTKKQFYRLITHGGKASLDFVNQNANLLKAYKQKQKIEQEYLNIRPRHELLLVIDPTKKGKIQLNDLKDDPKERQCVQKWIVYAQKIRDKFKILKQNKNEIQKYIEIQSQISRSYVNLKDISYEIQRKKRQLNQLIGLAKRFTNNGSNSELSIKFDHPYLIQLINRYKMLNIRADCLERLEDMFHKYKFITNFSKNINIQNYTSFSHFCQSYYQFSRNQQISEIRRICFLQMYNLYLQSFEPLIDVGNTLLTQGGFLLSLPLQRSEILQMCLKINQKIYKINEFEVASLKNNQEQDFDDEDEQGDDQQEDEEDMDIQDDQDDQDLDQLGQFSDEQEDNFDEQNDSSSGEPRPNAKPKINEVVDLSD